MRVAAKDATNIPMRVMTTPKMAMTIQSAKKMISMKRNLTRGLMMLPAMSPMERPWFRKEITIEPKSCTAPMKMEPIRIQTSAGTQPQMMAMAGPTIGPVPVIEVKWSPKSTSLSVAIKSTPSLGHLASGSILKIFRARNRP